jgi:hypothetical protein
MSMSISSTYEYLLTHYGPLLTLKHLAEVMHSTPNGVRMSISRKQQPLAVALAGARQRLGRRVYFEARLVAETIDQGLMGKPLQEPAMEGQQRPENHASSPAAECYSRCV